MRTQAKDVAFTLVEILVVIGIIATLVAILFPVFQGARNSAHTNTCLSNLHQIGTSIASYASDYDDRIPYAPSPLSKRAVQIRVGGYLYGEPFDSFARDVPDLTVALSPYGSLRAIFFCPLDRMADYFVAAGKKDTWFDECGASYTYDDIHALEGWAISYYQAPTKNVLVWDIVSSHGGMPGQGALQNALFVDLHVKTISHKQLSDAIDNLP